MIKTLQRFSKGHVSGDCSGHFLGDSGHYYAPGTGYSYGDLQGDSRGLSSYNYFF